MGAAESAPGVLRRREAASPDDPCGAAPTAPGNTTPSAPAAADSSPDRAQALAQLIAEGRKPRARRFTQLAPYRDVLITERRAGVSIRLIAQSLAKLDVAISEESLRVWFLKQKLPKRRRPRKKRAVTPTAKAVPVSPTMAARPVIYSAPTPAQGASGAQPGRRRPRIARDNY